MQTYLPLICEECRGELRLITSVAAFGSSPGARFYQCGSCGHLRVEDLSAPPLSRADGLNIRPEGA